MSEAMYELSLLAFTFQYVSIISARAKVSIIAFSSFTFQYVSIISNYDMKDTKTDDHLHSNMFLLFRRTANMQTDTNSFTFQYVSIISEVVAPHCRFTNKFTFQYVSIISTGKKKQLPPLSDLHSNMFLLFRKRGAVK